MSRVMVLLLLASGVAHADFKSLASPGPLHESHKDLDGQCDKCHVPFKGIPSSACLSCHTGTQKRIQSGKGTHARFEAAGQKCAKCHTDHRGRKHPITPPVVTAGFDHAKETGIVLDGKHAGAPCAGCHKNNRWVGLPEACTGCHADSHKGALGTNCLACHSTALWTPAKKSIADHKIAMTGGHAGLKCGNCHAQGKRLVTTTSCGDCHEQQHIPPDLSKGGKPPGTKASCATCHNTKDWKSATFQHDFCTCKLPGKHQTAACLSCHPKFRFIPTPFDCASCHKKDLKHEDLGACAQCHSALSWKTRSFDHNKPKVGFPLAGKHLELGCENCHTKKGVFKGLPRACEGCHKVPQHGDFGGCAQCHAVTGFDKPSFSHDKTRFPLDGQHQKAACATCHAKFGKGSFEPGPNACKTCHGDPHKGQFGRTLLNAPVQLASNGPVPHSTSQKFGCLDCHTTQGWKPSTVDVAKHAGFGFALKGKHGGVACARCHEAAQFVGTPTACNQCHLDRHRGKFGDACARCHNESGWQNHPGFDHAVATGFKIEGSHAPLPCTSCHGPDRQKLANVKPPIGCATCHTPKHGLLFGSDCGGCHKVTKFSDVPAFDHKRTHFPLDRRHMAVRCTTCHDAQRGPRIQPDCRFCHGDPHRGRTQVDCGDCHRADRWAMVRFDHDRTIFPLRGRHFTTPCRDCHTNDQYTGVRTECVSCHRADRQRADAAQVFHRGFGFDCSDAGCHRPFDWKVR